MKFEELIHGKLIKRYKRFLADIILENGETVTAHVGVAEAVILRSIPNRYTLIGAFFVLLGLYISEQKKHTVKGISPSK